MHPGVVEQLTADRKRQNIVVQRKALFRALAIVGCVLLALVGALVLAGWEVSVLHGEVAAERRKVSMHFSMIFDQTFPNHKNIKKILMETPNLWVRCHRRFFPENNGPHILGSPQSEEH